MTTKFIIGSLIIFAFYFKPLKEILPKIIKQNKDIFMFFGIFMTILGLSESMTIHD